MDSDDWGLGAIVRSCGGGPGPAGDDVPANADVPPSSDVDAETPATGRGGVRVAAGRGVGSMELAGPPVRTPAPAPSMAMASSSLHDVLEYLDLHHEQQQLLPRAPFSITPSTAMSREQRAPSELVSLFHAASTTSGQVTPATKKLQHGGGRKPGGCAHRPKRSKISRKSQVKKVVREVPVADGAVSGAADDLWAWRKYGQKPIKGSPYPRGYYKCSSLKACAARKLVERSPAKPEVLIVTYIADHCHAVPTHVNALAGTTVRQVTSDKAKGADRYEDSADGSSSVAADEVSSELIMSPVDMELDDFFGLFDDDLDGFFGDGDGDDVFGRRVSL